MSASDGISLELLPLKEAYESYQNDNFSGKLESKVLEVLEEICQGRGGPDQFITVLKFLGFDKENTRVANIVVDAIWLFGTQVDISDTNRWNNLAVLVKELHSSGLLPDDLLKLSLEPNLLHAAGISKDDSVNFQRRLVKINTTINYRQQKYNLLREETEGYSKLLIVLSNMPHSPNNCSTYVTNVCSIVGQFDLDPNRVLDVILDVFEQNPLNLSFVTLLEKFKRETIVHMLGFKFTYYQENNVITAASAESNVATTAPVKSAGKNVVSISSATPGTSKNRETAVTTTSTTRGGGSRTDTVAASSVSEETKSIAETATQSHSNAAPESLFALAATLIMSDLISIDDLCVYLAPTMEITAQITQEIESKIVSQVNSFGVINLNASAKDTQANVEKEKVYTVTRDSSSASLSIDVTKDVPSTSRSAGTASSRLPLAPTLSGSTSNRPPPPPTPHPVVGSVSALSQLNSGVVSAFSTTSNTTMSASERKEKEVTLGSELVIGSPEYDQMLTLFHEEQEYLNNAKLIDTSNGHYGEGNQYVGLIAALLKIRGWEQARYLLNLLESAGVTEVMRYSPDLRLAMSGLVLYSIDKIYQDVSFQKRGLSKKSTSCKGLKKRNIPVFKLPIMKQIESVDVFPTEILPLLSYLGYHCSVDNTLFTRLCRLSKAYVSELKNRTDSTSSSTAMDTSDTAKENSTEALTAQFQPILTVISAHLLPSLTVCDDTNPYLACQLWSVLSALPFALRFGLYESWKGSAIGKEALGTKSTTVVYTEAKALATAKSDLKRLAKENTKSVGRKLSKITHSNPLIVYNHVLSTIEVFDNLIPYVVDALKYSTDLSRDCMAYCLINQLKKDSTGKMKSGDTHYSSWFSALTKFTATFYCRYPSTELKGLLHYLMSVLSEGDSLDLLVLKELLCIMGGCETLLEVSQAQLESLSGGRVLRQETMGSAIMQNSGITANNNRKAMLALREELMTSETALPLLLFIAQIRCKVLYSNSDDVTQLKLISHLFDLTQDVLMQFTDFLVAGAKTVEHIAQLMPNFDVLITEIGLQIPVAFQLVRPIVRAALSFYEEKEDDSSIPMPTYLVQWDPFSKSMVDNIVRYVPDSVWERLSPTLYILFWSLSVYDIATPTTRYNTEVKRIKDRYAELENKKYSTAAVNSLTGVNFTSSEISRLNRQREADLSKMLVSMAALNEEMAKQDVHVTRIKNIIQNQKDTYCNGTTPESVLKEKLDALVVATTEEEEKEESTEMEVASATPSSTAQTENSDNILAVTNTIMQHMIYHRVLMSPSDAVFCTQFLLLLHEKQTPFFSLFHCYDRMIKTIAPLIFCTTEVEASFIGYALNDMFATINRWVNSKQDYVKECQEKVGATYSVDSLLSADVLKSIRTKQREKAEKDGFVVDESVVTHEMFCELSKAWHSRMTKIVMSSLAGKEYMYVRCALLLLSKISTNFPTRAVEGKTIAARVTALIAEEKDREDLQTMAKSLGTMLSRVVWIDAKKEPVKSSKKSKAAEVTADATRSVAVAALTKITGSTSRREESTVSSSRVSSTSTRDARDHTTRDGSRDVSNSAGSRAVAGQATNSRDASRATRTSTAPVSGADSGSWRDNKVPDMTRDSSGSALSKLDANRRDDQQKDRRSGLATNSSTSNLSQTSDGRDRRNDGKAPALNVPSVTGSKRKSELSASANEYVPGVGSATKSQKVTSASNTATAGNNDRRQRSNSRERSVDNRSRSGHDNKSAAAVASSADNNVSARGGVKRSREDSTKEEGHIEENDVSTTTTKHSKDNKTDKHSSKDLSKDSSKDSRDKSRNHKEERGGPDYKGATPDFDWQKNQSTSAVTASVNTLKSNDSRRDSRSGRNSDRGTDNKSSNNSQQKDSGRESRSSKDQQKSNTEMPAPTQKDVSKEKAVAVKDKKADNVVVEDGDKKDSVDSVSSKTREGSRFSKDKPSAGDQRDLSNAVTGETLAQLKEKLVQTMKEKEKEKERPNSASSETSSGGGKDRRDSNRDAAITVVTTKPRGGNSAKANTNGDDQSTTGGANGSKNAPTVSTTVIMECSVSGTSAAAGLENITLDDVIAPVNKAVKRQRSDNSVVSNKSTVTESVSVVASTDDVSVAASPPTGRNSRASVSKQQSGRGAGVIVNAVSPGSNKPPPPTDAPPVWDNNNVTEPVKNTNSNRRNPRDNIKKPSQQQVVAPEMHFQHTPIANPFTGVPTVPPVPAGPPPPHVLATQEPFRGQGHGIRGQQDSKQRQQYNNKGRLLPEQNVNMPPMNILPAGQFAVAPLPVGPPYIDRGGGVRPQNPPLPHQQQGRGGGGFGNQGHGSAMMYQQAQHLDGGHYNQPRGGGHQNRAYQPNQSQQNKRQRN